MPPLHDITNMFNFDNQSDIVVTFNGLTLNVHRANLLISSDYFVAALTHGFAESELNFLNLEGDDTDASLGLIASCYGYRYLLDGRLVEGGMPTRLQIFRTGTTTEVLKYYLNLYVVADKYAAQELKDTIEQELFALAGDTLHIFDQNPIVEYRGMVSFATDPWGPRPFNEHDALSHEATSDLIKAFYDKIVLEIALLRLDSQHMWQGPNRFNLQPMMDVLWATPDLFLDVSRREEAIVREREAAKQQRVRALEAELDAEYENHNRLMRQVQHYERMRRR